MARPGGLAWRVTGALLLIAIVVRPAGAHGFGQRYDLPVPLWLWVTAAAAAVVSSFAVIGLFVRASPGGPIRRYALGPVEDRIAKLAKMPVLIFRKGTK